MLRFLNMNLVLYELKDQHKKLTYKLKLNTQLQNLYEGGVLVNKYNPITGDWPIHTAVAIDCKIVVNELIALGVDLEARNLNNLTPLMIADRYRFHDIIRILVQAGANIYAITPENHVLLEKLFFERDYVTINVFLECGIKLDQKLHNGRYPIHEITDYYDHNDLGLLFKLLRTGVEVDARDPKKRTPLLLAARKGDIDYVALLLAAGASVHVRDNKNNAVIMAACRSGAGKIVDLIAERDKTVFDSEMAVGLYVASLQNFSMSQYSAFDALLYHIKPESVTSVLGEAYRLGRIECIQKMLAMGLAKPEMLFNMSYNFSREIYLMMLAYGLTRQHVRKSLIYHCNRGGGFSIQAVECGVLHPKYYNAHQAVHLEPKHTLFTICQRQLELHTMRRRPRIQNFLKTLKNKNKPP